MARGLLVHPRMVGQVRAISDAALPDTCAVQRATMASNSAGGRTPTWATVSGMSAVACRYAPAGGQGEPATPTGVRAVSEWVFTFSATLAADAIKQGDRLVVNGRTFEVIGGGSHSYEAARRIQVVEVAST